MAGFAGLCTCGSVWACPVCNAKVMVRRALDLGLMLAAAESMGYGLAFGTMTLRHGAGEPLGPMWDVLGHCWRKVISGKAWVAEQTEHGLIGWARAVEVTTGRNGWHPHIHAALITEGKMTAASLDRLRRSMFARWSREAERRGMRSPLLRAQDLRAVSGAEFVAEYVAKMDPAAAVPGAGPGALAADAASAGAGGGHGAAGTLGRELTMSQGKTARRHLSTRPVWALLDDVFTDGDADALGRWHEYEAASRGRRQMTTSVGLRDLLSPGLADLTDEEIAAEEVGSSADDLVIIEAEGWAQVVARPVLQPAILSAVRAGGLAGVRALLEREGVAYRVAGR